MVPTIPALLVVLERLLALLVGLALAPAPVVDPTGAPVPLGSRDDVAASSAPAPAEGRWEGFLLADAEGEPRALFALSETRGARGSLLERAVLWRDARLEVLHTEEGGVASPRLVFRELRAGRSRGRTWVAEWDPDRHRVRTLTWGTRGEAHGRLEDLDAPAMPLALIEELRHGHEREGSFPWLEPTTGAATTVHLRRAPADEVAALRTALGLGSGTGDWRLLAVVRPDGDVARRFLFEGAELHAMQWNEGDPWALRVDRNRWRDLERSWRQPVPRTVEASVQHR